MPIQVPRAWATYMNNAKASTIEKSANGNTKKTNNPLKAINDLKKSLETQIELFNQKSKLIGNLGKLEVSRDQLVDYLKEQADETDANLDSRNLKLVLVDNRLYRDDQKISIANNCVVNDVIQVLIVRLNQRIKDVEKQILD